jgi:hypothetical protein
MTKRTYTNDDLERDRHRAEKLAEASGIPAVEAVLFDILYEDAGLSGEQAQELAVKLANPVAFAMSMERAKGMEYGFAASRQSVANALGLGKLE